MKRFFKFILIVINIIVGTGLALSALSGLLNAAEHPRLVIAAMSFPIWAVLAIIVLLTDFFYLRAFCVFMAVCFGISLPMCFTVLPLNFERGKVPECLEDESWTLLSYNVANFQDLTGKYRNDINPTLTYILAVDPDVAVLAEGRWLTRVPSFHLEKPQLDSIYERFPYVIVGRDVTLLSKFPADTLHLYNFPNQLYNHSLAQSKVGGFVLDIHGKKTAIFGLHLKSLGLTSEDKNLYEEMTKGEVTSRSELAEIKNDVIAKIARANAQRAEHVNALIEDIDSLKFDNVIVCGDFNDTPGCYSLRRLEDIGLREVYPLVGNGYMLTYNKDRLYFQIDHVLFKGDMRPWSIRRGNLRVSDHYPLLTTFI